MEKSGSSLRAFSKTVQVALFDFSAAIRGESERVVRRRVLSIIGRKRGEAGVSIISLGAGFISSR